MHRRGIVVSRVNSRSEWTPIELDPADIEIVNYVRSNNLSMGSTQNLYATALACRYIVNMEIEGDFVECGVYRGGHSIIAAEIFKRFGANKKVFLFDTFKGMTEPTEKDFKLYSGIPALLKYKANKNQDHVSWAYSSLGEVRNNFNKLKLEDSNVIFIEGDVLQTVPSSMNLLKSISFLRLDTDWFDSTKIELDFLYPLLSKNGIIVIDDYGSWAGSNRATDEYFYSEKRPFFSLIDGGARLGIKP